MAGDEDRRLKPRGHGREEEEMEDQAARLPEDVLAAILRRVPPRWIAASRCVCKAWRDAVDGHRLLRADLLPLSLAGLFVHFNEHKFPEFFARPSSSAVGTRAVSGDLSFLPSASPHCGYFWEEDCVDFDDYNIKDNCNGLLLLSGNYVTKWMLKHDKNLKPLLARRRVDRRAQWILENINYNMFRASSCPEDNKKATSGENIEWNSDEDVEEEDMVHHCYFENSKKSVIENKMEWDSNNHNAFNNGDAIEEHWSDEEHYNHFYHDIRILGFHPYKEIVFLSALQRTCLAYHLNGSKIEEVGKIYPKEYEYFKELLNEQEEIQSSPYTPCWIEEFSLNS
ncbi:hypothetical protein ACQ4PT_064402 [Festuca glaucescens]